MNGRCSCPPAGELENRIADGFDDPHEQIKDDIFHGRKIDAIKKYRAVTREGLKESKDFIEALEAELRVTSPERFTVPPGGKGCGTAVVCLVLLVVAAAAALA